MTSLIFAGISLINIWGVFYNLYKFHCGTIMGLEDITNVVNSSAEIFYNHHEITNYTLGTCVGVCILLFSCTIITHEWYFCFFFGLIKS